MRWLTVLLWPILIAITGLTLYFASTSPLLAWRDPIYIGAGLAGIIAMILVLLQPLLALGALPSLPNTRGRKIHRYTGILLVLCVVAHVGGLWITSPPDIIDALAFASPTPFSLWGVLAMWAVFATTVLALFRTRLGLRLWRLGHAGLAVIIALGTVIHALQIEGTMEPWTKAFLASFILLALLWSLRALRLWTLIKRQ